MTGIFGLFVVIPGFQFKERENCEIPRIAKAFSKLSVFFAVYY